VSDDNELAVSSCTTQADNASQKSGASAGLCGRISNGTTKRGVKQAIESFLGNAPTAEAVSFPSLREFKTMRLIRGWPILHHEKKKKKKGLLKTNKTIGSRVNPFSLSDSRPRCLLISASIPTVLEIENAGKNG